MNKCVEQHMYKIATLHMASPKGKEKCLRKKNKFSRSLLMSVFALSRKKKLCDSWKSLSFADFNGGERKNVAV